MSLTEPFQMTGAQHVPQVLGVANKSLPCPGFLDTGLWQLTEPMPWV